MWPSDLVFPQTPRGCSRSFRLASSFFLALLLICFTATLWAQLPIPDVHVTPRVELPKDDPLKGVDPALRTNDPPLKVDVPLVLVSVTITDPNEPAGHGPGKGELRPRPTMASRKRSGTFPVKTLRSHWASSSI
jgi:hypothetical protein